MDEVLFGRPVLMFTCEFRPYGSRGDADRFTCNLVYFSAFQRLNLRSEAKNPMQKDGIVMSYEPGPWDPQNPSSRLPILQVGYLEHILCQAPLTPCFLDGSSTNTIPITKRSEAAAFEFGKTDSQAGAGDGSKVYEPEVNIPLCRFRLSGGSKVYEVNIPYWRTCF